MHQLLFCGLLYHNSVAVRETQNIAGCNIVKLKRETGCIRVCVNQRNIVVESNRILAYFKPFREKKNGMAGLQKQHKGITLKLSLVVCYAALVRHWIQINFDKIGCFKRICSYTNTIPISSSAHW